MSREPVDSKEEAAREFLFMALSKLLGLPPRITSLEMKWDVNMPWPIVTCVIEPLPYVIVDDAIKTETHKFKVVPDDEHA